jgi:hypothetical protein
MSPRDLVYVGHMLDLARKAVSKTQGISRERLRGQRHVSRRATPAIAFGRQLGGATTW